MEMEDNVEFLPYVDQVEVAKSIIDWLPTAFLIYLFADFYSKKTEREKFEIVKEIERFQEFGE